MLIARRVSTGEIHAARFVDGCMLKTTVQNSSRKRFVEYSVVSFAHVREDCLILKQYILYEPTVKWAFVILFRPLLSIFQALLSVFRPLLSI